MRKRSSSRRTTALTRNTRIRTGVSVPPERTEIERIGAREGWRARTFGRGMQGQKPFFHVVEFWIENRVMIEVVSPSMVQEYQDFMKSMQLPVMNDPESPV
jgi:hypothetical protein